MIVERVQDFVLLLWRGGRKFVDRRENLASARLHFREAFTIAFLIVDRECR